MRHSLPPDLLLANSRPASDAPTVSGGVTWYASQHATEPLPVDADGAPILPDGKCRAFAGSTP